MAEKGSGLSAVTTLAVVAVIGGVTYVAYKILKPFINIGEALSTGVVAVTEFVGNAGSALGSIPSGLSNALKTWVTGSCQFRPLPIFLNMRNTKDRPKLSEGVFQRGVGVYMIAAMVTWAVAGFAYSSTDDLVISRVLSDVGAFSADAELKTAMDAAVTRSGGNYSSAAQRYYHQASYLVSCTGYSDVQKQFLRNELNDMLVTFFRRYYNQPITLKGWSTES